MVNLTTDNHMADHKLVNTYHSLDNKTEHNGKVPVHHYTNGVNGHTAHDNNCTYAVIHENNFSNYSNENFQHNGVVNNGHGGVVTNGHIPSQDNENNNHINGGNHFTDVHINDVSSANGFIKHDGYSNIIYDLGKTNGVISSHEDETPQRSNIYRISKQVNLKNAYKYLCSCNWRSILSAFIFGVMSLSSTFMNKIVMSSYGFDYPVVIMLFQMILVFIILQILSVLRIVTLQRITIMSIKSFLLPAHCFALYTTLAMSALSHMNVPMYTMMRRTVPLATLVLGVPLLKKGWPSPLTIVAVNLLSTSCIVAGYGDLQFNALGYACAIASNITQAIYFIFIQKHCESTAILDTIRLNALISIPILAILILIKGEISSVLQYPQLYQHSFHMAFFLQLLIGGSLSASVILCTGNNSALTTSVVGAIKALAQTLIGLVTFGGVSYSMYVLGGVIMNFSGSALYVFSKYIDGKKTMVMVCENTSS